MSCQNCQSTETIQKQVGPHQGEYCGGCGKHLRWVPQGLEAFVWPVGAIHRGKLLLEILMIDRPYLEWAAENISSNNLRRRAKEALDKIVYNGAPEIMKNLGTMPKVQYVKKTVPQAVPSDDELPPWD